MKPLIAVVGCEARFSYMDAQRKTWVKDVKGCDVRFFLAKQNRAPLPDEVFLDIDDNYLSLPSKVRAAVRWALAEGYYPMLKLDDDVILFPWRLRVPEFSYAGWPQDDGTWCSGVTYWLSKEAMKSVAEAELTKQVAEDRWVGKVLFDKGIRAQRLKGIVFFGKQAGIFCNPRLPGNQQILSYAWAAAEFQPSEMLEMYSLF